MHNDNNMNERVRNALQYGYLRNNGLKELLLFRGMANSMDEECVDVVRARGVEYVLDHYPISDHSNRILAGGAVWDTLSPEEETERITLRGEIIAKYGRLRYGPLDGGVGGHRVVDFEEILCRGVYGILSDVGEHEERLRTHPKRANRDFYRAARISLEALLRFQHRYHAHLMATLSRADHTEHRNPATDRMLQAISRVPAAPALNFHDAIQSVWFIQFALAIADDISCTGRPDQYLLRFYENDIANETITRNEIAELIDELFLRSNELFGRWPETIMVGGRDREGRLVHNELTYFFLDAIERIGLVNPNVSICCNPETPDELIRRGLEILGKGYSHPAFYNDDVIYKGLIHAGVGEKDAHLYQNVTCVEIAPIGNADVQVGQGHLHMAKIIELMLNDGKEVIESSLPASAESDLVSYDTFDTFFAAFKRSVVRTIHKVLSQSIESENARADLGSTPLTSCFTRDCIRRGLDACAGGAEYHYCGVDITGFVTAVDSLSTVRYVVYEQKIMDLEDFAEAVSSNFEGHESLRRQILERVPRYGNDNNRVDCLAVELYKLITDEFNKYTTSRGGHFYPGIFSGWGKDSESQHRARHVSTGEVSGATPDGRKAGKPLSENIGPCAGSDRSGMTAMLNSAVKMDQSTGLGGISLNCRISGELLRTQEQSTAVINMIRTYFSHGGFQIQINSISTDTLRDAKKTPEEFPTLTVRVAGYSDYFNRLDPEQQDEIISRTEYVE